MRIRQVVALLLVFISILCLTGCSKEEIKETLNEVLFVNKIISYIELDMNKIETDSTNSNVPNPVVNNPFVSKKEETTVTSLDTFVYLRWSAFNNIETDLDLMALLVDKSGKSKTEYLINFNNLNISNNSVVHMGDDSKNSETLYLNLNDIPSDVDKIYLFCYFYNNDWNSLNKLSYSIDSLSEKYEEKIQIGSVNKTNVYNNSETDGIIADNSDYSNAIKLCIFERRGPIWHFKIGCEKILDLNEYLSKFGIETDEYTSIYLIQKAKEEAERIEAERIAAEEAANLTENIENVEDIGDIGSLENIEDINVSVE